MSSSTDTSFIIFKDIASLSWPGIRPPRYRVRYFAGTELYGEWSDKAAQATVDRNHFARFERVDEATWRRAGAGEMNGWADSPAPDALVWYDDTAVAA